jgi:hypothetical protein
MSTDYVSRGDQWTEEKVKEATGWKVSCKGDCGWVWTDGSSNVTTNHLVHPSRVWLTRYAGSNVDGFVAGIDAVSEHSEEYDSIAWETV